MIDMEVMGKKARAASRKLALASSVQKDAALERIAAGLEARQETILAANQADVEAARANGLSEAMLDRLLINPERLAGIAADLRHVVSLPDPVGEDFEERVLANGLEVYKQRVPIGVLGVIYEARPNVTIDITGLALKSGNAAILRGGSETIRSNEALVEVIQEALSASGLPGEAIQFINSPDRQLVAQMLRLYEYIDMIIPRGGAGLHKYCRENSLIPVIVGGIGICHLYVDETAGLDKSLDIIHNAKVQRPSVCNALDTVLLDQQAARQFFPPLVDRMAAAGVKVKVPQEDLHYLPEAYQGKVELAGPGDFDIEWLSLVLGVKVVAGLQEAIDHISVHSTGHSDGILSEKKSAIDTFVATVNSSAVFVNASTRFNDGGQLGLGAEVAVSTQKLHARGPMALRELTSYKWVVVGNGQTRP